MLSTNQPIIISNPDQKSAVNMNGQHSYYKEPNTRISRWEDEETSQRRTGFAPDYEKVFTPQTFSFCPQNYTIDEFEIWIRRHRIDDLQRRIAVQDFESNDADIRSPSPEPVYDQKTGLRTNTREQRLKDRYIKERNKLITEVVEMDDTYTPPPDYKPPKRSKKIYIPDPDNPTLNYIGQIIGPAGQTQKKLETESKCRIQIRGKGSQNKNKTYNKEEADENEPLHVLVTANRQEDLEKGAAMVEAILQQTDENKKYSLVVYDHLASSKKVWCEICGTQGHKFFECPEKVFTSGQGMNCAFCGSKNHAAADCPDKKKKKQIEVEEVPIEEEFHNFMKELQNEKEQKEKYKAITGKEPPRDFNYLQFQAEQEALKGGNLLAIQADTSIPEQPQLPAQPIQQPPQPTATYPQAQMPPPPRPAYPQPYASHPSYAHYQHPFYQQYPYYQQPQPAFQAPAVAQPVAQVTPQTQVAQTVTPTALDSEMKIESGTKPELAPTQNGEKKPEHLTQQLFNQQQQAFQSQQQTQIGAQSTFKPYQAEALPTTPQQPQTPSTAAYQYPPGYYNQYYNQQQQYYYGQYYPYNYWGYQYPGYGQQQPGQPQPPVQPAATDTAQPEKTEQK